MPGQTKISQFGLIFQSEENVARLDIVVNDSAMMGGTHPLGNFANLIGNGAIIPLGAIRQPVGQTSARAIFHGQPYSIRPFSGLVNGHNIWMFQRP